MIGLQAVAHDRATATAMEKDLRQKVNDLENQVADRSKVSVLCFICNNKYFYKIYI